MTDPQTLYQAIFERLSRVIDPETGVDVVRMRLIEDLAVRARRKAVGVTEDDGARADAARCSGALGHGQTIRSSGVVILPIGS